MFPWEAFFSVWQSWRNGKIQTLTLWLFIIFFFFGNLQDFTDYNRVRGEPMPELFGDLRGEAFPSSPKTFPAATQEWGMINRMKRQLCLVHLGDDDRRSLKKGWHSLVPMYLFLFFCFFLPVFYSWIFAEKVKSLIPTEEGIRHIVLCRIFPISYAKTLASAIHVLRSFAGNLE